MRSSRRADLSKIIGGEALAKAMPIGGWAAGQRAWNSPTASFLLSVGTADSVRKFGDPATAPDAKAKLAAVKQQVGTTGTSKDLAGIGDGAVLGTLGMPPTRVAPTSRSSSCASLMPNRLIKILGLAAANL